MPALASIAVVPSLQAFAGFDFEQQLAAAIAQRIELDRYDLWFRKHTKFVLQGEHVVIGVPNLFYQDFLQTQFGPVVRAAVTELLGDSASVQFVIDPELFRAARAEQELANKTSSQPVPVTRKSSPTAEPAPEPVAPEPKKHRTPDAKQQPKRKWKTLGEFVVGACNRVAHASALSAVEEPGLGANPLVVYGPVGTGKTHLLEGIYVGLRKRWPEFRVVFLTAEEFTNRFVAAMHQNKQSSFRKQFRECNVLIVDDLNFLASKKGTQTEFLHTFDALIAEGHQIVVSTDCHPRLNEDLMPELVDRLLGGAIWSVLPPDAETRLSLLRAKSANGPPIPDEILKFLADHLRGNIRELEGAIHSLRHFSRVTGRKIDQALAREALGDLLRHAVRVVGVMDVDVTICNLLRLAKGTLQTKARAWAVSHPRMIAIYLCRKHTAATYGEISIYFGNKTHSTAVAAEKKVKEWLQKDTSLKAGDRQWRVRELVEKIERDLGR